VAVGPSALEGLVMGPSPRFWRGKRVLLTGHTGFKGAWLALWLNRLGAEVTGLALPPETDPSLFELVTLPALVDSEFADIRRPAEVARVVRKARPDIVLHLAAQPLVRASYADPVTTYETNVMGTVHLLEALRGESGVRSVVVVTTDKVYRNPETGRPFAEDDPLGGHDPYSASKAACEIAVASYRDAFLRDRGAAVATARAGNVIGGGDWAADRLIPDAMRAWGAGKAVVIRNPQAVRPWQHVLEPLAGYLALAETLWDAPERAGAYNFGPDAGDMATVAQVLEIAKRAYGFAEDETAYHVEPGGPHEAQLLTLDNGRARAVLGMAPLWRMEEAVSRTVRWYRGQARGLDARGLCDGDFAHFTAGREAACSAS